MKKEHQVPVIRQRAQELARSGQFADWSAIETNLIEVDGLEHTKEALSDPVLRRQLDELCATAHKKET